MTVKQASSQQLLFPLEYFYSSNEIKLINELKLSLENLGFIFDKINDSSIIISGLPVTISESKATIVLDDLLTDLQDGIPESSFSQNDTIAKSMAKSLAIKTGTYLTEKEQESLVHNLFACKDPNVSPFQKPTFITMSVGDLDKKFAL
jgi:DNA mismatch repair protein MutL